MSDDFGSVQLTPDPADPLPYPRPPEGETKEEQMQRGFRNLAVAAVSYRLEPLEQQVKLLSQQVEQLQLELKKLTERLDDNERRHFMGF